MSAAIMNEMERLQAERDAWKQQAEGETIACDAYRNERDDLKQQLNAALEREAALAREASYHQQEIDGLLVRLRETQTERDAHMAHSSRVNDILFKTFSAIDDGDNNALPYDEYRDAFNESPATSLDKRDLIKQAEALEEIGHDESAYKVDKPLLRRKANNLRQRAANI